MSFEAIIGVIGTIAGTVLGYGLNEFGKRGHLEISFDNIQDLSGVYKATEESKERYTFHVLCWLNVFNSSSENKIMNNIMLEAAKDKKVICKEKVSKVEVLNNGKYETMGFSAISLSPKLITNLHISCENVLDISMKEKIESKDKLFLAYTNERGKRKKVLIK